MQFSSFLSSPEKTPPTTSPSPFPDYTHALTKDAFKNKRIGVPRRVFFDITDSVSDPSVRVEFEKALDVIRNLGAQVVDPADIPSVEEILQGDDQLMSISKSVSLLLSCDSHSCCLLT